METLFSDLVNKAKARIALEKMAKELREEIAEAVEKGELSQSTANELTKPKLVLIKGGKYE